MRIFKLDHIIPMFVLILLPEGIMLVNETLKVPVYYSSDQMVSHTTNVYVHVSL